MNRDDELRAGLRWFLASNRSRIIEQLYEMLTEFDPDWTHAAAEDETLGASLVNLRNAVAWQHSSLKTAERLALLGQELDRLFTQAFKADNGSRTKFYLRLYHMIWVESEGSWIRHEQDFQMEMSVQPLWAEVVRELNLGSDEEARWYAEARLNLALVVLDILMTLVDTRPLQVHLHEKLRDQGGWQWL